MKQKTQFASHSITEHIIRGIVGVVLLWQAVSIASTNPIGSIGLGILMMIAFRGCPVCWTIGLFETVYSAYIRLKARKLGKLGFAKKP
jgi:hypothetical protein